MHLLFGLLISLLSYSVIAQEARVELRSTVTGNQQQPNVLYLVPWQQAESPELSYQPMQSLVDDVFQPVERAEFQRELRYRQQIKTSQTHSNAN
ncbi:MAG: hypothetical protein ACJAYG_001220 [Oceanicoccus sp.]|jgi:hypothetical protein